MKKAFIIFSLLTSSICYGQSKDSTEINQEVFFSFGVYHLVTNNGSSFDSVIHGTLEFIEANKIIEFNKALARRKAIAVIKAKCIFSL